MKKILLTLLAAVAMTLPALAVNYDEESRTVDASDTQIGYTLKYWNDVKTDQSEWRVYPNWQITNLSEVPTEIKLSYVLTNTTTNQEVKSGTLTANPTTNTQSFYLDLDPLDEGNYKMSTTITLTSNDKNQENSFEFSFAAQVKPEYAYNFVFNKEIEVTESSVKVIYSFVEKEGKTIPEGATYYFKPGLDGPNGGDIPEAKTTQNGEVDWTGLNANTGYTIYYHSPSVTIDNVTYYAECPATEGTKTAENPNAPKATLNYTIINAQPDNHTGYFKYNIVLENMDDATDISYRVWLDAAGNNTKGESTTQEGQIEVEVPENGIELWAKGQVTYTLNGETKTINTNPNDFGFKLIIDQNTGVEAVEVESNEVNVYNAAGVCVRRGISKAEINNLPAGLYIVNGKKFIVK